MSTFDFKDRAEALTKMGVSFGLRVDENSDRLEMYLIATSKIKEKHFIRTCEEIILTEDRFPSIAKIFETYSELKRSETFPREDFEREVIKENDPKHPDFGLTEQEKKIKQEVEQAYDGPCVGFLTERDKEELKQEIDEWEADNQSGSKYWDGVLTDEEVQIARDKGWIL